MILTKQLNLQGLVACNDTKHGPQVAVVPVAKGSPQFALYHDTPKTQKTSIDKLKDGVENVKNRLSGSELLQTEAQAQIEDVRDQVLQQGLCSPYQIIQVAIGG